MPRANFYLIRYQRLFVKLFHEWYVWTTWNLCAVNLHKMSKGIELALKVTYAHISKWGIPKIRMNRPVLYLHSIFFISRNQFWWLKHRVPTTWVYPIYPSCTSGAQSTGTTQDSDSLIRFFGSGTRVAEMGSINFHLRKGNDCISVRTRAFYGTLLSSGRTPVYCI